ATGVRRLHPQVEERITALLEPKTRARNSFCRSVSATTSSKKISSSADAEDGQREPSQHQASLPDFTILRKSQAPIHGCTERRIQVDRRSRPGQAGQPMARILERTATRWTRRLRAWNRLSRMTFVTLNRRLRRGFASQPAW